MSNLKVNRIATIPRAVVAIYMTTFHHGVSTASAIEFSIQKILPQPTRTAVNHHPIILGGLTT